MRHSARFRGRDRSRKSSRLDARHFIKCINGLLSSGIASASCKLSWRQLSQRYRAILCNCQSGTNLSQVVLRNPKVSSDSVEESSRSVAWPLDVLFNNLSADASLTCRYLQMVHGFKLNTPRSQSLRTLGGSSKSRTDEGRRCQKWVRILERLQSKLRSIGHHDQSSSNTSGGRLRRRSTS